MHPGSALAPLLFISIFLASCHGGVPAAEPTPTPTPTPVAQTQQMDARTACGVGRGTGDGSEHSCPRGSSHFLPEVDAAINRVVAKHPELFDLDRLRGNGGYFVMNVDEYYRQVVQELGETGLCAIVDGGGEIAVKRDNDFSDQYHIMISAGFVRRGEVTYRATCRPAWF